MAFRGTWFLFVHPLSVRTGATQDWLPMRIPGAMQESSFFVYSLTREVHSMDEMPLFSLVVPLLMQSLGATYDFLTAHAALLFACL